METGLKRQKCTIICRVTIETSTVNDYFYITKTLAYFAATNEYFSPPCATVGHGLGTPMNWVELGLIEKIFLIKRTATKYMTLSVSVYGLGYDGFT